MEEQNENKDTQDNSIQTKQSAVRNKISFDNVYLKKMNSLQLKNASNNLKRTEVSKTHQSILN